MNFPKKRYKIGIIGDPDSGKTSTLLKIVELLKKEPLFQVGGFFQKKQIDTEGCIEYILVSVSNKEITKVGSKSKKGGFCFNKGVWSMAQNLIQKEINKANIIVIDELGRLESKGEGHLSYLLPYISSNNRIWIFTIRKECFEPISNQLGGLDKNYLASKNDKTQNETSLDLLKFIKGILSPLILIFLFTATSFSEERDFIETDKIVVYQTHEEASYFIYEKDEFDNTGGVSIGDLLDLNSEITTGYNSRGEIEISYRGYKTRDLKIMIDGIPVSVPYDGYIDNGKLPLNWADSIILVPPESSLLYGIGGLGGSLNIRTPQPEKLPFLGFKFNMSQVYLYDYNIIHALRWKKLSYFIGGGILSSRGFPLSSNFEAMPYEEGGKRDNSYVLRWNGSAKLKIEINKTHNLEVTNFYLDGEWGVPPEVDFKPKWWRFNTWRTIHTYLKHNWIIGRWSGDEAIFIQFYDNLLDSYDDDTYSTQNEKWAFSSWYHDLRTGLRLRALYSREKLKFISPFTGYIWLSYYFDRHLSEELKEERWETTSSFGSSYLTGATSLQGGFLEKKLVTTIGIQGDTEIPLELPKEFKRNLTYLFSPYLCMAFNPIKEFNILLNFSRRGRFPTLKERFSSSPRLIPNPQLKPEYGWNVGITLSYKLPFLDTRLTGYYSYVTDLITTKSIDEERKQFQNISSSHILGTTFKLRLTLWNWFIPEIMYSYVYTYGEREEGKWGELEYVPNHRLTLGLYFPLLKDKLMITTLIKYYGEMPYFESEDKKWHNIQDHVVWDGAIILGPFAGWEGAIKITNIADKNYYTRDGFPGTGRAVWFMLSYNYFSPTK